METLKFKKTGLWWNLSLWTSKYEPHDTCEFRRNILITLLISIVFFPAAIVRAIFWAFPEYRHSRANWGFIDWVIPAMLAVCCILIGVVAIEEIAPNLFFFSKLSLLEKYLTTSILIPIGAVTAGIFLTIGGIVIYLLYLLIQLCRKIPMPTVHVIRNDYGEPATQFGNLYLSLKEKWCKKIEWITK